MHNFWEPCCWMLKNWEECSNQVNSLNFSSRSDYSRLLKKTQRLHRAEEPTFLPLCLPNAQSTLHAPPGCTQHPKVQTCRNIVNEPGDPSSCSGVLGASTSKTQLGQDLCYSQRRCFGGDPPAGRERSTAPRSPALHPLTSSPPPTGRPPPGCEPLGRLSDLGCCRVTGMGGGRDAAARARAGEGDPRSSSRGGRSPGKSPLSRRRRRRTKRRRKRRERRRGRKPPWCPCSRCRGGRSSPRLSVSGGGCLVAFP